MARGLLHAERLEEADSRRGEVVTVATDTKKPARPKPPTPSS
jgi:hypothetical protein